MILKIKEHTNEFIENIEKENKIYTLDKLQLFKFYYSFYRLIKTKEKNIEIKIGEYNLDYKNSNLLSFCDFDSILKHMEYKKESLLYEYLNYNLLDLESEEEDKLFNIYTYIVDKIVKISKMNIDYELDDDLEKIIFRITKFKLNNQLENLKYVINKMLNEVVNKNRDKLFIIFYNSDLLELNLKKFDNCYAFDVCDNKQINQYNLICDKRGISYFDLSLENKMLESIWPVEFDKEKINFYINKYYLYKRMNIKYIVDNDIEYLVYKVLQKKHNDNQKVVCTSKIRDNVISFLEQS